MTNRLAAEDVLAIALCKGVERYIVIYDHATAPEALRTLGRWASNPEVGFTWYDAAVLCKRIREEANAAKGTK
jgi:hypothetical protein